MSLPVGSRLGPYEITAAIGAGGMGEVYRGRDASLNRDVAIKVLPAAMAADTERLARFKREAQVLASLSHANIAHVYGFEAGTLPDGSTAHFLAMEMVEGEDLSERLRRGAIPVDEAIAIARQIAEGLEEAHERGIIHRDLKPANIKIAPDGKVKILDFGLAKALEGDPSSSGANSHLSHSPTMSRQMTEAGMIMGTAAYMSPEQAKGKPVDRRADIWSFGVVLHEMLSGQRLFEAETVSEVLAAVLRADIDLKALPAGTPPGVRRVVLRCLDRDPKKRLRDIGEARLALSEGAVPEAVIPALPTTSPVARWFWPAVALVSVAGAVAIGILYIKRPAPAAPELVTFAVSEPDLGSNVTISPDGRHLLYGRRASGSRPAQLWLKSLGSLEARPIPGTEGVTLAGPVAGVLSQGWSSDSRSVLFCASSSLILVDTVSGQKEVLFKGNPGIIVSTSAPSGEGAVLYFHGSPALAGRGIWRVPERGGASVQVTQAKSGESQQRLSGFLPDNRRFLYFSRMGGYGTEGEGNVRVGSIDRTPADQDEPVLLTADGPAMYAPAFDGSGAPGAKGYLLFVSQGRLMAQSFDAQSARLVGDPVQLASGVSPNISASLNGHLAYRTDGNDAIPSELIRFDRKGRTLGTIGQPAVYMELNALDGRRVLTSRIDQGAAHLQILDPARGVFSRLNPGNLADYSGAVAPDDTVAFTFSPEGAARDIYVRSASGVGDARLLVSSATIKHPNSWSPDGQYLLYDDHVPGRAQDLLLVGRQGGPSTTLLATEADETLGQFSPDGKWIAYSSNESGRPEIYVRDFVAKPLPHFGDEKITISVNGGEKPHWSADGRELYFLQFGPFGQVDQLMATPVRPGTPFQAGAPVELFETATTSYFPYVAMADGTFIVNKPIESQQKPVEPFVVMLNWQALLTRNAAQPVR